MKKKLFLMLSIVAVLSCLFVISASAAVTTYDDAPERTKYQMKDDEIIEFYDGFTCPVYYVFNDVTFVDRCYQSSGDSFSSHMNFTYINGKRAAETGNPDFAYTFADVKGFDIPSGITSVKIYAGRSLTTLKWITFPSTITSLDNAIFQGATGLEECVMKFDENNPMTKFPTYMFYGCTNLKAFSMPDCFTEISNGVNFYHCTNMKALYLSKNLTYWYTSGGGSGATFDGCNNMYLVNEPFGKGEIPEKPTVYYWPKNLTSTDNSADFSKQSTMRDCYKMNSVLVFGANVTSMSNEYFFQGGPTNTVVFLGDMTKLSTGRYWGTTTFYFANPNDKSVDDLAYSCANNVTKTLYFCNAEGNTTHLKEKTEATLATCTQAGGLYDICFCGKAFAGVENPDAPALGHDKEGAAVTICYPTVNGVTDFFANAIHSYTCQREGCGDKIDEEKQGSALFTEKGYSKAEYQGGDSFTYGIKLNKDAEDEYVANGNVISYGFIIGAIPEGANGNIMNADGTTNLEKYILTDFATIEYTTCSIYNVRMYGLTDEHKAQSVYCNAYVIANSEVYYLGEAVTKEAVAISYSEIKD